MRSAWFLVALIGALPAQAGASPRAGKVVRVARKAAGFTGHPRFCILTDEYGSCMGSRAPEVGERMVALDRTRVLGTVRIVSVEPNQDGCSQTFNWMIKTVVESGDAASQRGYVLGVADVNVDLHSGRLLDTEDSPTGHQLGVDQVFGIDGNGDRKLDVAFVQFSCDDFGNASGNNTSVCQEVWSSSSKTLERVRQDRFRTCY